MLRVSGLTLRAHGFPGNCCVLNKFWDCFITIFILCHRFFNMLGDFQDRLIYAKSPTHSPRPAYSRNVAKGQEFRQPVSMLDSRPEVHFQDLSGLRS